MSKEKEILTLENIVKTYPGVLALDDVSVEIIRGEVHALVGENGAGKSTLIKTCSGAIKPDSGKIIIESKNFQSLTPKKSVENGIAVIYQEFNLVGELSVAENIFLGRAIRKGFVIDKKEMIRLSSEIFKEFEIKIDPNELVKNLTVGYQQIVEIAKAMSQNAKILIMDEPSAPLTNQEAESMYVIVDKLKAKGVTIIYISHRMNEIFRLSDRVTVLRDGRKIVTLKTSETNIDELVKLMVGRELSETYPKRKHKISNEPVLEVEKLNGNSLHDISFKINKGEVLGFAGLIGAGRTELAELIFGVKPIVSGEIKINGNSLKIKSPKQAIENGIALVPEDRKQLGAHLDIDVKGNTVISVLNRISKFSIVDKKEELKIADYYKSYLKVKTPNLDEKVKNLSGGNQQKVIIGKWLATDPDLIILDEPTRGIDVGAKYEIYTLINTLIESGKTILMISSEMEEIMGMSDRIIVLSDGRITGEFPKNEFDQEKIMAAASNVER